MITPSLIQEKNNAISLYLGLFEKSPTVLRKAIVTTPYSGFYMHTNFGQKYPKTAIVNGRDQVALELFPIRNQMAPEMFPEIVYGCLLDKARFCPLIGN